MQNFIRNLKRTVDSSIRDPGARLLQKVGITSPNALTLAGVALTVVFAVVLNVIHIPWIAALVLLLAEFADFFDGPLARLQPPGSRDEKFGAWLDTIADRFSEVIVLGGIAVYFTSKENAQLAFYAFVTGFLVTFVKTAAGEKGLTVNWDDRALLGYPGRVIVIMAGLFLTALLGTPAETILLWTMDVLLAFNVFILGHRIRKVLGRPKA